MIPPQKRTGFWECVMLSVKQMRSTSLSNFFSLHVRLAAECAPFCRGRGIRHTANRFRVTLQCPKRPEACPLAFLCSQSQCDVCQPGGHTLTTTCVHGQPPMCKHDCLQSEYKRRESRLFNPLSILGHIIFCLFVFFFSLTEEKKWYLSFFFFSFSASL